MLAPLRTVEPSTLDTVRLAASTVPFIVVVPLLVRTKEPKGPFAAVSPRFPPKLIFPEPLAIDRFSARAVPFLIVEPKLTLALFAVRVIFPFKVTAAL